ncbi:chitin deacetylase [Chytriomyces hyalinus]|nr:chitin deacetylase [Chytriomyces hyalinus]
MLQSILVCLTLTRLQTVFAALDFSWCPERSEYNWNVLPAPTPEVPRWTDYFATNGASLPVAEDITSCDGFSDANIWGATFDDGPGIHTPGVLDYFQKVQMKATFWLVGANIVRHSETVQRMVREGHEIGLHTYTHKDLKTLSDDQIVSELVFTARAVLEVTGTVPKYFRSPYGSIDDRVRNLTAGMGLRCVLWSVDSDDWTHVGLGDMWHVLESFKTWMISGVKKAISLQHDLFGETASVIPSTMDTLISSGKRIVPLSECVHDSDESSTNDVLTAFFESGLFEQALGLNGTGSKLALSNTIPASSTKPTTSDNATEASINPTGNTTDTRAVEGARNAVVASKQDALSATNKFVWIGVGAAMAVFVIAAAGIASYSFMRGKRRNAIETDSRRYSSLPAFD